MTAGVTLHLAANLSDVLKELYTDSVVTEYERKKKFIRIAAISQRISSVRCFRDVRHLA